MPTAIIESKLIIDSLIIHGYASSKVPIWYAATAKVNPRIVLKVVEKIAQRHDDSLAMVTTVTKQGA